MEYLWGRCRARLNPTCPQGSPYGLILSSLLAGWAYPYLRGVRRVSFFNFYAGGQQGIALAGQVQEAVAAAGDFVAAGFFQVAGIDAGKLVGDFLLGQAHEGGYGAEDVQVMQFRIAALAFQQQNELVMPQVLQNEVGEEGLKFSTG